MRAILFLLASFFIVTSCKKKNEKPIDDWFQIEIVSSRNFDCDAPDIIFLDRQQDAYQIIGDSRGRYIALGLPDVIYPVGTKLYVSIRRPVANEGILCTHMGPSWSGVVIERIK